MDGIIGFISKVILFIFALMLIFYPFTTTCILVILTDHGIFTTPDENYVTMTDKILAVAWGSWILLLLLALIWRLIFGNPFKLDDNRKGEFE